MMKQVELPGIARTLMTTELVETHAEGQYQYCRV